MHSNSGPKNVGTVTSFFRDPGFAFTVALFLSGFFLSVLYSIHLKLSNSIEPHKMAKSSKIFHIDFNVKEEEASGNLKKVHNNSKFLDAYATWYRTTNKLSARARCPPLLPYKTTNKFLEKYDLDFQFTLPDANSEKPDRKWSQWTSMDCQLADGSCQKIWLKTAQKFHFYQVPGDDGSKIEVTFGLYFKQSDGSNSGKKVKICDLKAADINSNSTCYQGY